MSHNRSTEVLVQRKLENVPDSSLFIKSQLDLAGKTLHVVKGSPSILRIRNLGNEIGDTIYVEEIEKPTSGMGTSINSKPGPACVFTRAFMRPIHALFPPRRQAQNHLRAPRKRSYAPCREGGKKPFIRLYGKAFLFNSQFRHTRTLHFPIIANRATKLHGSSAEHLTPYLQSHGEIIFTHHFRTSV